MIDVAVEEVSKGEHSPSIIVNPGGCLFFISHLPMRSRGLLLR